MQIIIQDGKTGKKYLVKGHVLDWEIFKESEGKMVDGVLVGKGDWTSCRNYPRSVKNAVATVVEWLLADPNDEEAVVAEAKDAAKVIGTAIKKRVAQISAEVITSE